jgi:imidazolonepropionase
MWDTLWINANLATMEPTSPYGHIQQGAIAVEGDRIAWVGQPADLPDTAEVSARQVIDVKGKWITPGLIDCHTHLVYAGNRAQDFEMRLQGMSYADIAKQGGGIRSTVTLTRQASEVELVNSALKRLHRLQQQGVTTVEIKSGYGLDLNNELKLLRVARTLEKQSSMTIRPTFLGAHALPPEFEGKADEYIDFVCAKVLPLVVLQELADAVDAFCETIAFSPTQVRKVFQTAKRLQLPVKLHADQLSNSGGAALAAEFNALSADHLEYTSVAGVQAMARAGTVAVLLPGAFYTLQETQLPPVDAFRQYGVPMAIATDSNPGTSPTTSPLLMLNMACTLFRLTPAEALAGMTRNGARALGCEADYGTLTPGKKADFAFWDIQHPAELAYAVGDNPCVGVVKHGKTVWNSIQN